MNSARGPLHAVRNLSRRARRYNGNQCPFHTSSRILAAQNFSMPAMSPTMTEGNITSWKVKEGDRFSTGDVLLEIETDKAQMDVEAQEDGVLAKITKNEGAKGVQVGSRIAVIAEQDDDLSSLDIPLEDPATDGPQSKPDEPTSPSRAASQSHTSKAPPSEDTRPETGPHTRQQTYPLYPSIAQLVHENGLPPSEVDKIPASGPKGRLLKGDVLAYLGRISSSYSSEQSTRISKLQNLDLSNAKPAPSKAASPAPSSQPEKREPAVPQTEEEEDTEVALPISLTSALSVQKRLQDTLNIHLPLSTFIARATQLANEDLPHAADRQPTAEELFNDILGLGKVDTSSTHGSFSPQIIALPQVKARQPEAERSRSSDVYDVLTNHTALPVSPRISSTPILQQLKAADPGNSLFSVSTARGDEKRARVFLERMKTILQTEPGRLII